MKLIGFQATVFTKKEVKTSLFLGIAAIPLKKIQ